MLNNVAWLAAAGALVSSPAWATAHHKKHNPPKAAVAGAAIGGAVGLAAGGPGVVVGAAAGAALGAAADKREHVQKHAGYKYYKGWYYDGRGHRFTAADMEQRHSISDASAPPMDGYKGFYGWYYDGKGSRFRYWKGAYFDEQGHRHSVAEVSHHPSGDGSADHVPSYAGYKYYKGWYYDGRGHRFTTDEMQKEAKNRTAFR